MGERGGAKRKGEREIQAAVCAVSVPEWKSNLN